MQSATDDFKTAVQEAQGNDPPPELDQFYECLGGLAKNWLRLGYNAALRSLAIPTDEDFTGCGAEIAPWDQKAAELAAGVIKTSFYDGYALAVHRMEEDRVKGLKDPTMPGLTYIGEVSLPSGKSIPIFKSITHKDRPSINTVEGWTALANRANSKAFNEVFGREPSCLDELRAWENAHFPNVFCWDGQK